MVWMRMVRSGDDSPSSDPRMGRAHPAGGQEAVDALLRDRIVMVGDLDDASAARIVAQLMVLERADPAAELSLYVNSDDGSAAAALSVHDTIQYLSCPVATLCVGQARGVASLLLAAGTAGRRAALPSSRIVLRRASGSHDALGSEVETAAREIAGLRRTVAEAYARHCGRQLEEVEHDLERGLMLTAHQAVEWGLIDQVLEKPPRPWAGIISGMP